VSLRASDRDGYDASLDASELRVGDSVSALHPDGGDARIAAYAGPGKAKARIVCQAFVDGAGGGRVHQPPPKSLGPGGAVFFGVTEPTRPLWNQARREGREWFYLDNAYFDVVRGRMLRASRNAVQASGWEAPDWPRWAALGIRIQPWRRQGQHVLVVAQSSTHMRCVAGQGASWWRGAVAMLKRHTDREIVVRGWRSDKRALAATLSESLRDAWALVTWSSAAANEALLAGVPVFAAGPCAASPMAERDLTRIETPIYPDGRAAWAAALAGRQWTLDEMRAGLAWHALHA